MGGLLSCATSVLYGGDRAWPDGSSLRRFIGEQRVTLFGCGAAFLANCIKDSSARATSVT